MTALVSFASLFLSIFLVQMGSGSLGPLDALAGVERGFTTGEIGLLDLVRNIGWRPGILSAGVVFTEGSVSGNTFQIFR